MQATAKGRGICENLLAFCNECVLRVRTLQPHSYSVLNGLAAASSWKHLGSMCVWVPSWLPNSDWRWLAFPMKPIWSHGWASVQPPKSVPTND